MWSLLLWNSNCWSGMEYKRVTRRTPVCLECGDKIRYGRTDKKFCCVECKDRHHNRQARVSRTFKRKILCQLDRNYGILDSLLYEGTDAMEITDLLALGFVPDMVTSIRRLRNHWVCGCFDIKYIMTPTRLYSISKIQNLSLSLQVGTEKNRNK